MKLKVDIRSNADATVIVDIPEEDIANLAEEFGIAPQDVKLIDLADLIHEKMETPTICAYCSGWGDNNVSLELGDEWEIDKYDESVKPEYRSIRKID